MTFLHLIVTNFNIGYYDKQWFEGRLIHFTRYTIPSIVHQTNQNFIWLILLDEDTDPLHVMEIHRLTVRLPNVVVRMIPHVNLAGTTSVYGTFPAARKAIRGFVPNTLDLLLTTGLDNDDAISQDYIETVQKKVHSIGEDHNYLVDVHVEINVDLRFGEYGLHNIHAGKVPSTSSTAVERPRDAKTVMAGMHGTLWNPEKEGYFPKRVIVSTTCMHIVHGGNNGLEDNRKWRVRNPRDINNWKRDHSEGYDWLTLLHNRSV
jgi:hypothetical protein